MLKHLPAARRDAVYNGLVAVLAVILLVIPQYLVGWFTPTIAWTVAVNAAAAALIGAYLGRN